MPFQLASPVPATGVKRFWPVVKVEPTGTVDVVDVVTSVRQSPCLSARPRHTVMRDAA